MRAKTMPRPRGRAALATLGVVAALASGCGLLLEDRESAGTCGDGVVQQALGEQCDGDGADGRRCSMTCTWLDCGNGVLDPGEECDDGLANDNGGDCTRTCKKARCGDSFVHLRGSGRVVGAGADAARVFEVCDDGNQVDGDGCSASCTLRGRLSLLLGTVDGRGVVDGVGSAARVAGVGALVAGAHNDLYFWDGGACAVRRLDITSGRVETVAGVVGRCDPIEDYDAPGAQARFAGSGTGVHQGDGHELVRVGETLYAIYQAANRLRTIDLRAGKGYTVATCASLVRDNAGAQLSRIQAAVADPNDSSGFFIADESSLFRVKLPCSCNRRPLGSCDVQRLASGLGVVRDIALEPAPAAPLQRRVFVATETQVLAIPVSGGQPTLVAGASARGTADAADGANARFRRIAALAYAATPAAGAALYVADEDVRDDPRDPALGFDAGWARLRRVGPSAPHAVLTIAGVTGAVIDARTPESDGFGAAARFVAPRRAAQLGSALYIGEPSAIRSMSLDSGQVATVAGVLRSDFLLRQARAVASSGDKVYVATRDGQLQQLTVDALGVVARRRVSLCNRPVKSPLSDPRSLEIDALVAAGEQLFVLDRSLGGICRIYLGGKDADGKPAGQPGCAGCLGTWQLAYPSTALDAGALDSARSELRLMRPSGMAYDGKQALYLVGRLVGYKRATSQQSRDLSGVLRVDLKDGSAREIATASPLPPTVWGIAHHGGKLYVSTASGNQIAVLDLADKLGALRFIGDGKGETRDSADSKPGRFCNPLGIVAHREASGTTVLYVGEGGCSADDSVPGAPPAGNAVRRLDPATERVTTLLGPGERSVVDLGVGRRASVGFPAALAASTDSRGALSLFIVDMWADALLRVD